MAILESAKRLARCLVDGELRVVFAESCTGGMISAELAKVPGVSEWLCGSAVTYRSETKTAWLDVGESVIGEHTAVSGEVAKLMAEGVLHKTPEATVSAAITGHFGPHAPEGFDGLVFVGIGLRMERDAVEVEVQRYQLETKQRENRQAEAVELVLGLLLDKLA